MGKKPRWEANEAVKKQEGDPRWDLLKHRPPMEVNKGSKSRNVETNWEWALKGRILNKDKVKNSLPIIKVFYEESS